MTGGSAAPPRVFESSLRHGDVGENWGDVVAPAGAFAVGDAFLFRGELILRPVRRALPFPTDSAKRLVHHESAAR